MCFFSHGGKSLAIGKGLNPRTTSQQPNLSRSCDLRISIVFSYRILPTRIIIFFCNDRQQQCASLWFTVHLIDMTMQHPWHQKKTFRCVRWSIQAFLSSAAKCCELIFPKLFVFTFVVSARFVAELFFRSSPTVVLCEFDSQCQCSYLFHVSSSWWNSMKNQSCDMEDRRQSLGKAQAHRWLFPTSSQFIRSRSREKHC